MKFPGIDTSARSAPDLFAHVGQGVSRRAFLGAGIAAAALIHVDSVLAGSDPAQRTTLFAVGTSADVRRFRAAAPRAVISADHDVGAVIEAILYGEPDGLSDVLMGLTRESDFHMIEQVARERGFSRTYLGRHCYDSGELQHAVEGNVRTVEHVIGALGASGPDWASGLALTAPRMLNAPGAPAQRVSRTRVLHPPGGCPHLASWCLVRGLTV